jgi:uncharacterized protein (DUF486 family)
MTGQAYDPAARRFERFHDAGLILHLKGGMVKPLLLVIPISWGIALVEYSFAVPANRIGYSSG